MQEFLNHPDTVGLFIFLLIITGILIALIFKAILPDYKANTVDQQIEVITYKLEINAEERAILERQLARVKSFKEKYSHTKTS